jgi:hypothetical protein
MGVEDGTGLQAAELGAQPRSALMEVSASMPKAQLASALAVHL